MTDGRGGHNRKSDLRRLVQYHGDGLVDMIYARRRLRELARHVQYIHENE